MGVTGDKALPPEIANQIIDRTDGVPLFIEELTKSVIESELVMEAGNRYTVTGPAAPLAIPTTLHASLLARLEAAKWAAMAGVRYDILRGVAAEMKKSRILRSDDRRFRLTSSRSLT